MHRIPLLLVGLAIVFPATAEAKACSSDVENAGNVKATNVGCAKARQIVASFQQGETKPFNFTCSSTPYKGGANVTCKKSDQKVRFQVAD